MNLTIDPRYYAMTHRKASQLAAEDGAEVVGVIIRSRHGRNALVEGGAVRWVSDDALFRLMHPGPDTTIDQLEPVGEEHA